MPSFSLYRDVRLPQHDEFVKNMPRLVPQPPTLPLNATHIKPRYPHLPRRHILLLILLITLFLCTVTIISSPFDTSLESVRKFAISPKPLLESSNMYVVSLPRRRDRRSQMEHLRMALGLSWEYVDATDSSNDKVDAILKRVQSIRLQHLTNNTLSDLNSTRLPFQWPSYIDSLASSDSPLFAAERAFWDAEGPDLADTLNGVPMLVAQKDFTLSTFYTDVVENKVLTAAKIACWDTHLSVISRIAHSTQHDVGIILEDDVDMERDIRNRIDRVWNFLPESWDIVFLGHCWSNETYYPAITHPENNATSLHPSRSPKCTHAYALSQRGARRLLLHLVHPPFAYSRAIDQAFAWLIKSKRIRSFSLVPSVVAQRKVGTSDVSSGNGSRWKDVLAHGVFPTRGNLR